MAVVPGPIIVRGVCEARAAVAAARAAGCSVTLISAPGGGAHGGGGWFHAVIRAAGVEVVPASSNNDTRPVSGRDGDPAHPCARSPLPDSPSVKITAILDCADLPGCAQAAIRAGVPDIRFTGSPEMTAKLAAIAAAAGVRLHDAHAFAGPGLDLRYETDPAAACRRWLAPPDQDTPHRVDSAGPIAGQIAGHRPEVPF